MAFTVKWLGQGGFIVTVGNFSAVIDPYLTDDIYARTGHNKRQRPVPLLAQSLKVDTLIATHDHDDHLDPATVIQTDLSQYAGPDSCLAHYKEIGIPKEKLVSFNRGDCFRAGDARFLAVPAEHTSDSIGVVVQYRGVTAYFSGDTLYSEALRDIGILGIDILFICINGRLGNMNYKEAAQLAGELPCHVAVPHHFDMFTENAADPNDFIRALDGSGVDVVVAPFNEELDLFELMYKR